MKYSLLLSLLLIGSAVAQNITVPGGAITAGSVGPTQLASTAVTPGSYTNTDLTVDADGRITAASNGSGGGSGLSRSAWTTATTTLVNDTEHVGPIAANWVCAALPASVDGNVTELKVLCDGTARTIDFFTNVTVYRLGGGAVTEVYTLPINTSTHFRLEYNNSRWDITDIIIDSEAANTLYAGPGSGGDAVPTFRAMVAADIPNDLLDSQHYAAASIDDEHLSNDARYVAVSTKSSGPYTIGTDSSKELKGGFLVATGAMTYQGAVTLVTGMSWTIKANVAGAVVFNPDNAHTITLDGVALAAGDSITSTSTLGDVATFTATSTTTIDATTNGWTDTN